MSPSLSSLLVPLALLLLVGVLPSLAWKFGRCQLARDLYYRHGVPWHQLANWVCIASYESNFETGALGNRNNDGSHDHGIFQISDQYWCSPPGRGWGCGISCDRLRDGDISDDVACARRVYNEHTRLFGDGFTAWAVYHWHCSGGRAGQFLNGCF